MSGSTTPRGGRPRGSKNRATIERETIEAEIRKQRIAAGVVTPVFGKEKLEYLLGLALEHLADAIAGKGDEGFSPCFDRVLAAAKALTPYQSPQYRALAVAHVDRPAPVKP
jgi:hypothetical protein